MQTALILIIALAVAGLLIWPPLAKSTLWRAAVTPLASIIGSGFLVLGPVLHHAFGAYAALAMAVLCALAWGFSRAIAHNILRLAEGSRRPIEIWLDRAASWALAFAYMVSVAYYLNLFGAFEARLTPVTDPHAARWITTAALGFIVILGLARGFHALERVEQISVGIKLAVIAGLLGALWMALGTDMLDGQGVILTPATETGPAALFLVFGLIVTVQGFETVRYMGAEYDPALRIRAMHMALLIATLIYMAYLLPLSLIFTPDPQAVSETAIIDMMGRLAPILAPLLMIAALSAQFSAALADTGGSGVLLAELTCDRIGARQGYVILGAVALILTWVGDVFSIIGYASRAFAFYYALQAAIAAAGAGNWPKRLFFFAMALLGGAITLFGTSGE